MEVKKHVIFYLDILGYKNLISSCKNPEEETVYLEKIYSLMMSISAHIDNKECNHR